jgi:SAM-dependent methyltransferase
MKCPICGWQGAGFLPKNRRENVLCPECGSFERHRHQCFAATTTDVLRRLSEICVLHVGPEHCETILLQSAHTYVSLDLRPLRASVVGDIAQAPFRDGSFDLVWASHVLEHISKVTVAVAEVCRVLKPSGVAVFDVPIYGRRTVRLTQPDRHGHIWHPGNDWPAVYAKAGLTVQLFWAADCPCIYGPLPGSLVAICWKPEHGNITRD